MDMFWEKPNWKKEDRHLSTLKTLPFQRPFPTLNISPGIAMIRGPRQIGKSTWLKTILLEELSKNRKCFYISAETISDYQTLHELLKSLTHVDTILIDEISYVVEWWRAVKHFTDQHHKVSLILTGSNSYDLKKGIDLMPGRWMKGGGEYTLLPMLFNEWQEMRKLAGWKPLEKLEALKTYFRIGGFPVALIEAGEGGAFPIESMKIYQRWLLGDLLKLNRQEIYLKELMGALANIMTTSVSLQKLAQKTQMMSYHTAQEYISILEHCFAIRTLYAYNPESKQYQFKKEKKFYFTDPLIYYAALDFAQLKIPQQAEERVAEMVAHEFIARKSKRLGYFSNQNGEVDFIFEENKYIEVKWTNHIHNLSKAYKNIKSPYKGVWFQSNFLEPLF